MAESLMKTLAHNFGKGEVSGSSPDGSTTTTPENKVFIDGGEQDCEPAPFCNLQIQRFLAKVDKRGEDECWPWLGAKDKTGYGRFRFVDRLECAHRVAFMIAGGQIPSSKLDRRYWVIMHSCDNRACCNPKHLSLGTYRANAADMLAKGRGRIGLKPHNQARADFIVNDPRPLRKFCAETGIPLSTAGRIRRAAGRSPAPKPLPPQRGVRA